MDFRELLAMLREPPEDGLPDTVYDDIDASYTEVENNHTAALAERDSAIAEREGGTTRIAELELENVALKTTIADMVLSAPGKPDEGEGDDEPLDPDTIDIDDLF